MSQIEIDIQEKRYLTASGSPGPLVISDLSLRLARGEFVCLVGPSGCGKTSLLHVVAGLDHAFRGAIKGLSQTATLGYVFQEPRLLPWRSVRENIELALSHPEDNRNLIDHLLTAMGLFDVADAFPERLSLGMSRRVALVRAFAVKPSLLLMDEPFVSLDAPTARRIRDLTITVWEEYRPTVLFITHDLKEAISLADRIVFLKPSPMNVLHNVAITAPRTTRNDDFINAFRDELTTGHPDIGELL